MNVPDAASSAPVPQPVKAFKPVTVFLSDNNDTLEGFLNLTAAPSPPSHYDHQGAAMYVVAVILVYGLSMVLLIGSLAKKNMNNKGSQDVDDRQVSKYLNDVPNLKERSQRDKYKELKHNIVQIVNSRALVPLPTTIADTGVGVDVERGLKRISENETNSYRSDQVHVQDMHIDDTIPKTRLTDSVDCKVADENDTDRKVSFSPRSKRASPNNVSPESSVCGAANETSPLIPVTRKGESHEANKNSGLTRNSGRQTNVCNGTIKPKSGDSPDSTRLQQSLTASWGGARVYDRYNSDPLAKSLGSSGYQSMHSPVPDNDDPVHAWLFNPHNASGLKMTSGGETPPLNRRSLGDTNHSPSSSQYSSQTDLPASAFSCSCPAYGNNSFVPSSPTLNGQHRAPEHETPSTRHKSEFLSETDKNPWRKRSQQAGSVRYNSANKEVTHMKGNHYYRGNSETSSTRQNGDDSGYQQRSNQRTLRNGHIKVTGIPKIHVNMHNPDTSRRISNGNHALATRVTARESVIVEGSENSILPPHEPPTGRKTSETLKTSVHALNGSKYTIMNGNAVHHGSESADTPLVHAKRRDSRLVSPRHHGGRISLPAMQNHAADGLSRDIYPNRKHLGSGRDKSHSLPITPQSYSLIHGHPSAIPASPSTRRGAFRDSNAKETVVLRSLDREMGESYGPYSRTDVCYNSQYVPAFFDSDSDELG